MRHFDFDNDSLYDEAIKNSNVVINLVGSRAQNKNFDKAVYANVHVAQKIAEACQRNPNVRRLIHFSAAGGNSSHT